VNEGRTVFAQLPDFHCSGLSVTLPFAFASRLCPCRKAKFASDSAGGLCELKLYIIRINYFGQGYFEKNSKNVGQQSVHTSETLRLAIHRTAGSISICGWLGSSVGRAED
jgi:hypothetical protein